MLTNPRIGFKAELDEALQRHLFVQEGLIQETTHQTCLATDLTASTRAYLWDNFEQQIRENETIDLSWDPTLDGFKVVHENHMATPLALVEAFMRFREANPS